MVDWYYAHNHSLQPITESELVVTGAYRKLTQAVTFKCRRCVNRGKDIVSDGTKYKNNISCDKEIKRD